MTNKIFAYAHTHWDREWYQTCEIFRCHLVAVLKRIIDELESGKLTRFYLDGQAIIIEDALALAPELAPRLSALMQSGELAAGPWYVMPDEMLVCGESLVRNLKFGIDYLRSFGAAQLVGYAPDTFGHSQDLPRILKGFAVNSAFVWRGVPPLSCGPCFWWQSPDGSRVLAYHLSRGYYQTSLIEKTRGSCSDGALAELALEVQAFAEDRRQWENSGLVCKTPNALLYPIGADHTAPPRNLKSNLDKLNKKLEERGLELSPVHLSEFAEILEKRATADHTLVSLIARELRDNSAAALHGNAYLLQGVLSSRLYLKRANRECERRLFRFAEPLYSQLAMRRLIDCPSAELKRALSLLLKNHPHDSICGCSVDAVHDEMMVRYARMGQIIDTVADDIKRKLSSLPDDSATAPEDPAAGLNRLRVFNPSAKSFSGVLPFSWFRAAGSALKTSDFIQIESSSRCEQLFAGWGRVPYYNEVEKQDGYIWLQDLPAFGEQNFAWPLEANGSVTHPPAKLRGKSIENGILKLTVNENAQLCVCWTAADASQKHYELQHQIYDTADGGDTYNYDLPAGDKPIQAKLLAVLPGKKGPLISSLILKYELKIPDSLEEMPSDNGVPAFKRSAKKLKHEIETEVILKRGSRLVEFETSWQNLSSDHRLELRIATGHAVHTSFAENHFSLVTRYHQTRSRTETILPVDPGFEAPCDRHPAQRFVICNGQLFLNKGLPEYGAEGKSIVLTLLRSVSLLSRGRLRSRGGGAGPHLSVPGAECKGLNRASYAWAPLSVFQRSKILSDTLETALIAEAYELADLYEFEALCAFSQAADTSTAPLLRCEDPRIRVCGSYVSADRDAVFLRLQNLSNETCGARLLLDFDFQSCHLCRLDEEIDGEVFIYREYLNSGGKEKNEREICALEINFNPQELKTIKLRLQGTALEKPAPAARARRKRAVSSKTG